MKQSDVSQPIIDKCKELAKYWRMKIYEGCWVMVRGDEDWEITHPVNDDGFTLILFDTHWSLVAGALYHDELPNAYREYFLIPSISDCLEKLYNQHFRVYISGPHYNYPENNNEWYSVEVIDMEDSEDTLTTICVPSLHEALLSALAGVLGA